MEIRDGWVVVITIAALVLGLAFGGLFASESIVSDCKKLGRFRYAGEVYACSPVGKGDSRG